MRREGEGRGGDQAVEFNYVLLSFAHRETGGRHERKEEAQHVLAHVKVRPLPRLAPLRPARDGEDRPDRQKEERRGKVVREGLLQDVVRDHGHKERAEHVEELHPPRLRVARAVHVGERPERERRAHDDHTH